MLMDLGMMTGGGVKGDKWMNWEWLSTKDESSELLNPGKLNNKFSKC